MGRLISLKIPVRGNENIKKWYIWSWLLQNRKLIEKADIIHCHDVFFWYLPFRFLYPQKPVYTTFHGYETVFPPTKKAIRMRRLGAALSKGSINVGDYIEKWYGTKPTYVTYGGTNRIKSSEFRIKNPGKKLRILFVGRLEEDTGVRTYLQALALLKKKKVPFEFEACGDGTLRPEAEKSGKVHGFVENLIEHLNSADFVFASSYLSILEAFAKEKLVFAVYDNPLKKDYLTMTPFADYMVIEKNPENLADQVLFLKNNSKERDGLTHNAYEWVRRESWDKVADMYLKLWQKT